MSGLFKRRTLNYDVISHAIYAWVWYGDDDGDGDESLGKAMQ